MRGKVSLVETMGEKRLLLPELITRGLAATDRLTYYVALLRAAQAHAKAPYAPAYDLSTERVMAGVGDAALDFVVDASAEISPDTLRIPAAGLIVKRLFEELELMLEPLRVASLSNLDLRARLGLYEQRLDDLIVRAPPCNQDQVTTGAISALTALVKNRHDTVHQLALDLHLEVSDLESNVRVETVDGANVYGLTQADRALVAAFMRGLNQTAWLKFDHPGLATTAARDGDRLSIQSDLGVPDAHLVAQVADRAVTLQYTDVHAPRVRFLKDLLRPYGVQWNTVSETPAVDGDLIVGRYSADSLESLQQYLAFVGSRLVFLIDWRRARKRLGELVKKSEAVALLKWAADKDIGHRAFLQAGDLRLINAAVQRTDPLRLRSGVRLDEWLGPDGARSFLRSVLRITSTGLRANHSLRLIEDEIEAGLVRHIQSFDRHLLHGVAEHAAMISTLSERIQRSLMYFEVGSAETELSRTAELAKTWSTGADEIALQSLRLLERAPLKHDLHRLLAKAGAAGEALEDVAHLLTLLPPTLESPPRRLLSELATLAGGAVNGYVRCLEEARDLSKSSPLPDIDRFLVGIERLSGISNQAGRVQRAVTEALLRGTGDFHELYVVAHIAREFERAAALLAHCSTIVRDHVLNGSTQ